MRSYYHPQIKSRNSLIVAHILSYCLIRWFSYRVHKIELLEPLLQGKNMDKKPNKNYRRNLRAKETV